MAHASEEQLILHHYGEAPETEAIAAHLEECEACREALGRLRDTLREVDRVPVPWRGADYGDEVWRRVEPRLTRRRPWRRWLGVAALAASLLLAFALGRASRPPGDEGTIASTIPGTQGPRRVVLVAIGEHLERSQMVLVELVNTPADGESSVNVVRQQARARSLLPANRLYRQTVELSGEGMVGELLADLERVLVELANGPDTLSGDEIERLRERISGQGLLLRARVIRSRTDPALAPGQPQVPAGTSVS